MASAKNKARVITSGQVTDLRRLLTYCGTDEQKHYIESCRVLGYKECRRHIWHSIRRLEKLAFQK